MSDNDGQPNSDVHPASKDAAGTSLADGAADTNITVPSDHSDTSARTSGHPNIPLIGETALVIDPALLDIAPEPVTRSDANAAGPLDSAADYVPEDIEALLGDDIDFDPAGFDPDTLANLAALSRIANEEDDVDAEQDPEQPESSRLAGDQGEARDNSTAGPSRPAKSQRKKEAKPSKPKSGSVSADRDSGDDTGEGGSEDDDDGSRGIRDDSEDDQGDEKPGKLGPDGRKKKRKRNRTVL